MLFVIDYTNNRKAKESLTAESSLLNDDSYETYSLGDIKFRIPDTYQNMNFQYFLAKSFLEVNKDNNESINETIKTFFDDSDAK